ncbi:hypothetical protein E2C01_075479 [Portunus trituberculatus]|uniref:Uncharacterized protein n=1 Tax=Portunus trituberculatus TaxID=210409 RepID=A0A5B7IF31_PORTR|nr:hypothetical protein [Portunus trituberculatus]
MHIQTLPNIHHRPDPVNVCKCISRSARQYHEARRPSAVVTDAASSSSSFLPFVDPSPTTTSLKLLILSLALHLVHLVHLAALPPIHCERSAPHYKR